MFIVTKLCKLALFKIVSIKIFFYDVLKHKELSLLTEKHIIPHFWGKVDFEFMAIFISHEALIK